MAGHRSAGPHHRAVGGLTTDAAVPDLVPSRRASRAGSGPTIYGNDSGRGPSSVGCRPAGCRRCQTATGRAAAVFRWPGGPTSLSSGNSAWRSSRRRSTPTPCIEAMDETDLPHQPLGQFLGELAARLPTPGAGAAAAIEAALSASLVAMIGRFTADDQTADAVSAIVAAADAQRSACLAAAAAQGRHLRRRTRRAGRAITTDRQPPTDQ